MKTIIKTDYLKVAVLFASTETTRYYMNGVHVTGTATDYQLVSTCGVNMFVARQCVDEDMAENDTDFAFTIPTDTCKLAIKAAGRAETISLKVAGGVFTIAGIQFTPIGGSFKQSETDACMFPDWQRVVPQSVDGVLQQFDTKQIALWERARKILKDIPSIHHNSNGPAILAFSDENIFGLLMPMRRPVLGYEAALANVMRRDNTDSSEVAA
jgi:hypothetical protein